MKLEPSGWGTKVTLTAELEAIEAVSRKSPSPSRGGGENRSSRGVEVVEGSQWGVETALSFAGRRPA